MTFIVYLLGFMMKYTLGNTISNKIGSSWLWWQYCRTRLLPGWRYPDAHWTAGLKTDFRGVSIPYYEDKTPVRPSYIVTGNFFIGKTAYLYWNGPQDVGMQPLRWRGLVSNCGVHQCGGDPDKWAVRIRYMHTGLILGWCPANERRRYKVTPSLIGWGQT